ncbi:hypothetical protein D3C80_1504160 [compost metagenome]
MCAALLVAGIVKIYLSRYASHAEPAPEVVQSASPKSKATSVVSSSEVHLSKADYIDQRIPRIPDVPSSAPFYDDLTKPVAYPKPFCVSSKDDYFIQKNARRMVTGYRDGKLYGCRCNSQQGSRLDISFEACMAYVEQGVFDPAIPDRGAALATGPAEVRGGTVASAQPDRSSQGANTSASTGPVVTVVADSEYASRPWR